nr:butyrophilin-like protein 10 isoform X1 [Loxodonta africana]
MLGGCPSVRRDMPKEKCRIQGILKSSKMNVGIGGRVPSSQRWPNPVLSHLPLSGNVTFDVIGPNEPILAIVGKGADLPCHLSPNISAKDMELRWYRDKFSPAVYVYERGKNVSGEQMEEYRGRTTFLIDHIANGTAAVRIHNVTVFDNGTYHCYFQEGTRHGEATLWLKVVGLGSQPRIRLRDDKEEGVQVECTSAGWYPQPQVEWRDFRGKIIPSVANLSVSPTSGLFAVVSNVVITDRAMEGLYCSIANPLLFKEKLTVSLVPASFSRSVWPKVWRISLPLILMALGLVVAGAICISWKKLRDEVRKCKETEDQQQASSDNGGQGKQDIRAVYTCMWMHVWVYVHVYMSACVFFCIPLHSRVQKCSVMCQ